MKKTLLILCALTLLSATCSESRYCHLYQPHNAPDYDAAAYNNVRSVFNEFYFGAWTEDMVDTATLTAAGTRVKAYGFLFTKPYGYGELYTTDTIFDRRYPTLPIPINPQDAAFTGFYENERLMVFFDTCNHALAQLLLGITYPDTVYLSGRLGWESWVDWATESPECTHFVPTITVELPDDIIVKPANTDSL